VGAGAAPEVGPAPGSPAARGGDDHEGDFGEEAPTEIFGEIDSAVVPGPAGQPSGAGSMPRAAIGSAPPKPPPRPGTNRTPAPVMNGNPMAPMPVPRASGAPGLPGVSNAPGLPGVASVSGGATPSPEPYPQAHASPAAGYAAQGYPGVAASAHGTPGPSPSQPQPLPPAGAGQAKTLLGAAAPVGLPNYANYTPPLMSGQQQAAYPSYPPQGMNPSQPGMPVMSGPPSAPGMAAHGMQPMQGMGSMPPGMQSQQMPGQPQLLPPMGPPGQPQPGYPGHPGQPYGQNPYGSGPAPALEAAMPGEGRRRSSIVRDIAIGVAIAGVVLGGFLAVKFLVLDSDSEEEATTSQLADLLVTMPGVEHADLFIDSNRHASVGDNVKVQVPAGAHEVKLVGPGGQECKQDITLVAGQVTTIECNMKGEAGSGSGAGSAAGTGSAGAGSADTGSAGSASADTGSAGGAGSAGAQVAIDDKAKTGGEPVDDKAGAQTDKTVADKAAADKAAADKADKAKLAADKAAADKADKAKLAADKAAADKAAADKAKLAADKIKKDKLPPEDNPADRAGAPPAKGWVTLTSKPSAKILVDGSDTGMSTPITGRQLALPGGRHKITFQIGGDKYTFTVVVKSGETVSLDKQLQ
jgi:hypothetical protein